MNGFGFYGILLDKRNYDGNNFYELTRVGALSDLQTVTTHRDEIVAYLDHNEWHPAWVSDIRLTNERTGYDEPGRIYVFTSNQGVSSL